jgi:hypothetical protein
LDYQGAEDEWSCEVYILQSIEGVVEAVNVQNCTLDDMPRRAHLKTQWKGCPIKPPPLTYRILRKRIRERIAFPFFG